MIGKFKHGSDITDCMNYGSHIPGGMGQRGGAGGKGLGRSLWQQQEGRYKPLARTKKDSAVVNQRRPTICFRPFDLLENY